jgi:hypothetical protein
VAELVRPAQQRDSLGAILRLAPDLRPAHAHRAEPEATDGEVADVNGSAESSRLCHLVTITSSLRGVGFADPTVTQA